MSTIRKLAPSVGSVDMSQPLVKVVVDRDSVCAGDDGVSQEVRFEIAATSTVTNLIQRTQAACPLASIAGGQATWLIDAHGNGRRCIGVMAQQWEAPRLTVPEETTVGALFGIDPPTLFFRYWCQSDPEEVFQAVKSGAPLPPRS